MEKVKKIKVPAVPETTKEITIFCCDLCERESKDEKTFRKCHSCHRLVCKMMSKSCGQYDPNDWSDYPDWYCEICVQLKFDKYKNKYRELEYDYDEKVEKLDKLIKKESLNYDSQK